MEAAICVDVDPIGILIGRRRWVGRFGGDPEVNATMPLAIGQQDLPSHSVFDDRRQWAIVDFVVLLLLCAGGDVDDEQGGCDEEGERWVVHAVVGVGVGLGWGEGDFGGVDLGDASPQAVIGVLRRDLRVGCVRWSLT